MPRPSWAEAVARVNIGARQPILFIHDPRLTPDIWRRCADGFEQTGYAVFQADLPDGDDPLPAAALYFSAIARALSSRPAVVGHGLGGLVARDLAHRGLSAATVVVGPEPADQSEQGDTDPEGALLVLAEPPDWRQTAEAVLSFIQRFV